MEHVKTIREYVSDGKVSEAYNALDNLLALGPHNVEALKLKAMLLRAEGRYNDEAEIWHKIIDIDREDIDAIEYFYRQQVEDREHFYFSDDLPHGGRRFLAYPKALINTSVLGLLGCLAFLMISKIAEQRPEFQDTNLVLGLFLVLVMGPWLGIIVTFLRSIRHISVTKQGIQVATRFRKMDYHWHELAHVALAHSDNLNEQKLDLVLYPMDQSAPVINIDMNDGTSAIRARTHLIRDISRLGGYVEFGPRSGLPDSTGRKTLKY